MKLKVKTITALILAIAMTFALSACAPFGTNNGEAQTETTINEQAAASENEPASDQENVDSSKPDTSDEEIKFPERAESPDEEVIYHPDAMHAVITNRLDVAFKYGTSNEEIQAIAEKHGGKVVSFTSLIDQYTIEFSFSGMEALEKMREELEAEDLVEDVYYCVILDVDLDGADAESISDDPTDGASDTSSEEATAESEADAGETESTTEPENSEDVPAKPVG